MENMKKDLVLFDFDKTITDRDTFFDFMSYACGKIKVSLVIFRLFPHIFLHLAGFIDGGKLKELFFRRLIGGWKLETLENAALRYTEERLPQIVRGAALNEIKKHRENGADMAIVSASPSVWIKFFARRQKMDLLSTELEINEGTVTGNIEGRNCRGQEKVERIKKHYDLSKYENIFAYGDSAGDREMIALANHKYYRVLK